MRAGAIDTTRALLEAGASADATTRYGVTPLYLAAVNGNAALIDALRPGGHYAVAGAIAGPMIAADLRRIYLRDITLHGCTYQPPRVFARLMEMVRAGEVRPRISATYPLRDIARAQAEFQTKTHAGKLILLPPETDT